MPRYLARHSPDLGRDIRPRKHEQQNHKPCDRQHLTSLRTWKPQRSRYGAAEKTGYLGVMAQWLSPVILACALDVRLVPSMGSGATWFLCKKEAII